MTQMAGIPSWHVSLCPEPAQGAEVMPALTALPGGMNAEQSKGTEVASATPPFHTNLSWTPSALFDELITKLSLTHIWNLGSLSCSWTGGTSCAPKAVCHNRAHQAGKQTPACTFPTANSEKSLDSRQSPISATTRAHVRSMQLPPTRNCLSFPLSPGGSQPQSEELPGRGDCWLQALIQ